MNTLDELRGTLTRHADELDDVQRYVRPVAVRARIRAVRRRRAGTAAVALAVATVAGVATIGSLRGPDRIDPAGPVVVGIDVPERVSVTGFPYTLERTETLAADETLKLTGSHEYQAVSLVARDLGSGSATLLVDGEPVARARDDEVLPPVPAWPGQRLEVRVDGAGSQARTGVAVYESTGELADGVDNGTAVFRESVANAPLQAAAFAPDGETEATVTFVGRLSAARIASYCTTQERGLWVHVEIDDDGPMSSTCRRTDSRDAGASWSSFEDPGGVAPHTVRTYVTRGDDGPEVTDADVELGVGVYEQPADVRVVDGMTVDRTVEYAGRTWELVHVDSDGAELLEVPGSDRLVGLVASGEMVRVRWEGGLTRGASAFIGSDTGPARLMAGVLLGGDTYDVRVVDGSGQRAEGALLVYRPV